MHIRVLSGVESTEPAAKRTLNGAAVAVTNARLMESRVLADKILSLPDANAVVRELYVFIQDRVEVINTLDSTAEIVSQKSKEKAGIVETLTGLLLKPKAFPALLDRLTGMVTKTASKFIKESAAGRDVHLQQDEFDQIIGIAGKPPERKKTDDPIRVLHISDLHIEESTAIDSILQPLIDDLDWDLDVYQYIKRRKVVESELEEGKYIEKDSDGLLIRINEEYPKKFKNFSEFLYPNMAMCMKNG